MTRVLKVGCLGLLVLLVLAVALAASTQTGQQLWLNRDILTDGIEEAELAKTPEGLVELMATRPRLVSIAAWAIDDPDGGLYFDADHVRPLASTAKIVVAAALASAFEKGERSPETRVPLAEVERLYLKGTDGDAHPTAMRKLGNPNELTLEQLASVMLHHSDNAATDALMVNLGRAALEAEVARLGIAGVFATAPYSGNLLALIEDGKASREIDEDRAWALAQKLVSDSAWAAGLRKKLETQQLPPAREQRAHRVSSPNRGTARGYATLMERIATDSTGWGQALRRWLSWPMKLEAIEARFEQFGTKGGSTASVVTGATFARPRDGGTLAVSALFFEDLPMLPWVQLMQKPAQQKIEQDLLTDPKFRRQLGQRLSASDAGE